MSGLELWSARKQGNELRTERSPKWEKMTAESERLVSAGRTRGEQQSSVVVDALGQI